MNVLAFDTCFPALSVAVGARLGEQDARVISQTEEMATGHAERMMPLISELLAEADTSIAEIDRIAITIGPGSFTGTRIGIAAARAFKLARQVDTVPFTSLEAIALSPQINAKADEDLVVAMDAHRGEAYVQVFDGTTRAAFGPPRIVTVANLASISRGRPLLAVGSAAEAVAGAVSAIGVTARARTGTIFPDMRAAAIESLSRNPELGSVEPLYLRPPDAKPQDGKSLQRTGA